MEEHSGLISRIGPRKLLLLLFVLSIGAALGLAEVGLRIYQATLACHMEEPVPRGLYRKDPRFGHTLRPGYVGKLDGGCWETPVRVSSDGTRGEEIGEKAKNTHRILLAGDSYVFGLGVNESETLSAKLQNLLPDINGKTIEVINAGVPGWTSHQSALLIEEMVETEAIDTVFFVTYLGNDLEERVQVEERLASGEDVALSKAKKSSAGLRSYLPSSVSLKILKRRSIESAYRSGASRRPLTGPWFDLFFKEERPRISNGLRLFGEDLVRMRATAAAAAIPLRVIVVPSWMQVTMPTAEIACREYVCEASRVDMRMPNRALAGILDELKIPYLDLTDSLVDGFSEGGFTFISGHWDEPGTALVADEVAVWISKLDKPVS
jgi:hypothetical protein